MENAMKASLASGVQSTTTLTVARDRTIGVMGEGARVYATLSLVRDKVSGRRQNRCAGEKTRRNMPRSQGKAVRVRDLRPKGD
jgi:hypothetical protein